MNLIVDDVSIKKHICKLHSRENIMPKITWTSVNNAKSYSIVFEDPDTKQGNFIHMFTFILL